MCFTLPSTFVADGIRGGAGEAQLQPRYTGLGHVLLEDDGQLIHVRLIAGLLHECIISTMLVLKRSSSLRGRSYFPYHEKFKHYLGHVLPPIFLQLSLATGGSIVLHLEQKQCLCL